MEALAEWLRSRLPPEPSRPAVVHGDFKLDNVVLASDDPRRTRSRCSTGRWRPWAIHLSTSASSWPTGFLWALRGEADALSTVTDRPGWLPRDEGLARYEAVSGRDCAASGSTRLSLCSSWPSSFSRFTSGTSAGRPTTLDSPHRGPGSSVWRIGRLVAALG